MIGGPELVIVLAVVLVLFGAGRLPEFGRALPQAMEDIKAGAAGELPEDAPARRPPRPARPPLRAYARPIGIVLAGVGILLWFSDQALGVGVPLLAAAALVTVVGVALSMVR